jgi:hypothetical protein
MAASPSMQVLMQDATDKRGAIGYNTTAVGTLTWFGFDLTMALSGVSIKNAEALLPKLATTTSITLAPDMSDMTLLGATDTAAATAQALAKKLSPTMRARVKMVVLEPEGSQYLSLIQLNEDTGFLSGGYITDASAVLTAWRAAFTNLESISCYATSPASMIDTRLAGVVLECYNIWNVQHGGGATFCNKCAQSPNCLVDFNTTKKCGGTLQFPGAGCGPNGYKCPALGCNGTACVSHVQCGVSVGYGGGIYDPLKPFTTKERGTFLGTVLSGFYGPGKDSELLATTNRWVVFPFTDASCPTMFGALTTADDFGVFLSAFKQALVDGGTFKMSTLDKLLYGTWGTPKWMTAPVCQGDADCTDPANAKCGSSGTCVPCSGPSNCKHLSNLPVCDSGTCKAAAAPAGCQGDADCTDPANAKCGSSGKCVPCTAPSNCTHLSNLPVCDSGTCRAAGGHDTSAVLSPLAIASICVGGAGLLATIALIIWASVRAHKTPAKPATPPAATKLVKK